MNKDRLTLLEDKVQLLTDAIEKCIGISLNNEIPGNMIELKDKCFTIHFSEEI